jgi:hypothetical protein
MGVSKQAARQRFAQQAQPPAPAGSQPQGKLKPKERLLACLEAAGREAAADGAAEIGTHHLLIGLFEEGVAAAILEGLGGRADAGRAAARELFPGTGQPGEVPPPESAEARDAICGAGAGALARRGGCGYAGPPGPGQPRSQPPGDQERTRLLHQPGQAAAPQARQGSRRGVLVLRQAGRRRAAAGRRAGRAHLRRVRRAV